MDSSSANHSPSPSEHPRASLLLEQAYGECQDELFGMLYFLTGSLDEAQEALQDTYHKCWRHRHSAIEAGNLRAWMFRTAITVGRERRGSSHARRRRPAAEAEASLASLILPSEADTQRREQLAHLRRALLLLRSQEQEVFLLRQNGQLDYEQIAQAVGLPVATVKTRMRLALRRLRETPEDKNR